MQEHRSFGKHNCFYTASLRWGGVGDGGRRMAKGEARKEGCSKFEKDYEYHANELS